MNKTRVVSAIGLSVLLVAAIFAVSAHAGKPPTPPGASKTVLITVSGAIEGIGTNAANMAITFLELVTEIPEGTDVSGAYVANPDYSLVVTGTGRGARTLSYYYCDNVSHKRSVDVCGDVDHDPWNYQRLIIENGALQGKGNTAQIVFAKGSPWRIWRKAQGDDPPEGAFVASGKLGEQVIYKETPVE